MRAMAHACMSAEDGAIEAFAAGSARGGHRHAIDGAPMHAKADDPTRAWSITTGTQWVRAMKAQDHAWIHRAGGVTM